jgi:hypothetical protein
MSLLKDRGNYFEVRYQGTTLRVSKNNGTVTDPKAALVKGDILIIISTLSLNGHKDLANKVANKYRGKFD